MNMSYALSSVLVVVGLAVGYCSPPPDEPTARIEHLSAEHLSAEHLSAEHTITMPPMILPTVECVETIVNGHMVTDCDIPEASP